MTDHCKDTRDRTLARFAERAATLFAANPVRRSVLLAVAQYWNDSANDEVHGFVVASARATPVWPHECEYTDGDETNDYEGSQRPLLAGEECWHCGGEDVELDFYGGYGDAMVGAFEAFCSESAHQGMDPAEAYVPFAIARRAGDRVEIERVGHVQRPPAVMIDSTVGAADWPDARARALFEEVCLHATDDGPRAVLADYLLEHHPRDPRGEALALSLARDLDGDALARRDALLAAHAERWLFPLGDVIPAGCAHFERGFLARADVYAETAEARGRVLRAPAWGTVHTVRFAPGSRDVISPAMTALRDVGPIRDDGLLAIARAERPWQIETLRIAATAQGLDAVVRTPHLPRLATLEIAAVHREVIARRLRVAPWHATLERLVFVDATYGAFADWRALRDQLDVPELAIALAAYGVETAAAWEIGFCAGETIRVRCRGWHAEGTLAALASRVRELPAGRIELVSTATRIFTDDDAAWLRAQTDRDVIVQDLDGR